MRTLNKMLIKIKAPIPIVDRILEIIAFILLLTGVVLTAVLYQLSPDKIVSNFSLSGDPASWSEKEVLWYMAFIFIALMLVSAASAYNRRMINLPFRLKEPVLIHQELLIFRMSRCITLCIGVMWLSWLLIIASSCWGFSYVIGSILAKLSLFLLLLVSMYFSAKAWWIGRKY